MKRIIASLTLMFIVVASWSQSYDLLKSLKKERVELMKISYLLVPLLTNTEATVLSKTYPDFNLDEYNKEIIEVFSNHANFKEIIFYYTNDLDSILLTDNVADFVLTSELGPIDQPIELSMVFIAMFQIDGYQKEPQYQTLKLKKKHGWQVISEEKIKTKKSKTAYQQELNRFKPTSIKQGIVVKRLRSRTLKINKKRKFVVNFENYYPCYFSLPKEEVFKRVVDQVNITIQGK